MVKLFQKVDADIINMNRKITKSVLYMFFTMTAILCFSQKIDIQDGNYVLDQDRISIGTPSNELLDIEDFIYSDSDFNCLSKFGDAIDVTHENSFVKDSWRFIFENISFEYVNQNGYIELTAIHLSGKYALVSSLESKNPLFIKPGDSIAKYVDSLNTNETESLIALKLYVLDAEGEKLKDQKGNLLINNSLSIELILDESDCIKTISLKRSPV